MQYIKRKPDFQLPSIPTKIIVNLNFSRAFIFHACNDSIVGVIYPLFGLSFFGIINWFAGSVKGSEHKICWEALNFYLVPDLNFYLFNYETF